ncbi:MAG: ureidoglycolate lyase [Polyangiaceae bacterium]|nr:ureidoglycolate lyase [Polyangiaceae bacterium]
MTTLAATPLDVAAYAPYGDVLAAGRGSGRPANQGTSRKFEHLTRLENRRGSAAKLHASVFRATPREAVAFELALLERHPASAQAFIPMNATRYLAIVALGASEPDPATARAFVVPGAAGITYHPGVWHHPIVALDGETDFVCLVWEAGGADDCEELPLPAGRWKVTF